MVLLWVGAPMSEVMRCLRLLPFPVYEEAQQYSDHEDQQEAQGDDDGGSTGSKYTGVF